MSAIPTKSREVVLERSGGRCERCGGRGGHWHHRRRRNVSDGHQHCPCNGVYLCDVCHSWAHANPEAARDTGFIVLSSESEPSKTPVINQMWGRVTQNCDGTFVLAYLDDTPPTRRTP